jgi:YHS domain-containing protein
MIRKYSSRVLMALLVFGAPSAWGQQEEPKPETTRRQPPPKLTESQEKVAKVTINPEAIKAYLIERPSLAMLGKDVVSLVDGNSEQDGNKEIAGRFDGQTYLFASVEHKTKFEQDPGRYVPALAGYSLVAYKNTGKLIPGSISFRLTTPERLYLFATEDEKKAFESNKEAFADADVGMQGFSPVVLVEEEVLQRGDKKLEVIFEGRRFHFASAADRDVFAANPGRYYPTLGGIDIVQLAGGKSILGEAKFSVVYKNRLYSFASAETRDQFVAQAEPLSDFDIARGGIDQVARVEGKGEPVGHYGISAIHRGLRYLFVTELHRERFQGDPEYFLNAATGSAPSHSTDSAPAQPEPRTTAEPEPTKTDAPTDDSLPKNQDADPNVEEPEPVK